MNLLTLRGQICRSSLKPRCATVTYTPTVGVRNSSSTTSRGSKTPSASSSAKEGRSDRKGLSISRFTDVIQVNEEGRAFSAKTRVRKMNFPKFLNQLSSAKSPSMAVFSRTEISVPKKQRLMSESQIQGNLKPTSTKSSLKEKSASNFLLLRQVMEDALSRTRADHDNVKVHRSIIADLIKGEMTAEGNTAFSEKLARIYKMTTSGAPLSAVEKNLEVFLASIDKTVLNRETSTNPEEIQTKPEEIQTKPEKIQTDKLNGADKLLVGSAATDASKKRPKKTFTKQMLRRIEAEIKRQEMEIAAAKEAKQAFVNQITMATMEAELSTNGNPNSAFEFLRYLLRRTQGQFRVTDPAVAYRLLHLLAKKGDLEVLRPVLHLMHMEHLPVSAQVLAAKLEALGRGNGPKDEIVEVLNELTSLGLSATNLFTDCCYQRDEHLYVLKAVQRVFPDFKPPRKYVSLGYEDNLLQPLKTASFVPHSMLPPDITLDVLRNLTDEQVDFEKQIMTMIPTICSRSMSQVSGRAYGEEEIPDARSIVLEYEKRWRNQLQLALEDSLMHTRSFLFKRIIPFLKCVPMEDLLDIILSAVRRLALGSEMFSPSAAILVSDLGYRVYSRYMLHYREINWVNAHVLQLHDNLLQNLWNETAPHRILLGKDKDAPHKYTPDPEWPKTIITLVGKTLYDMILAHIKIDPEFRLSVAAQSPAFYSIYRRQGYKRTEEIKPHPALSRLYRPTFSDTLFFSASELPMLCPPLPWTSRNRGGHLVIPAQMIKTVAGYGEQQRLLESLPSNSIVGILDSLTRVGSVPWKINSRILDLLIKVFRSGGDASLDVPVPAHPDTSEQLLASGGSGYRNNYVIAAQKRRKAEAHSLWCDTLNKLSIADFFRNRIFWMPHNLDFRGRAYTISPHLTHIGNDKNRAMLCFAKGKPLGPDGLHWLKLQVVNLTGKKKRDPISQRLQWLEENLEQVFDSADRPLEGNRWWADSDDPWQTLAACMELTDALRSPNPETFVSHLPVHQDGSCNGLQHYAALGRDMSGGRSVNLLPDSVPRDVYSDVAAVVEAIRAQDEAAGMKVAEVLNGHISRKVIKQTVMTTVYGVTKFGARQQIYRQLKEREGFPKSETWLASFYLTTAVFQSLGEMFRGAQQIQDWLTDCAGAISKIQRQPVQWTTPLGLPVVQPYFKAPGRPNTVKQRNAFPPNYIHSLDATHMMLTALGCGYKGITFVSVHDCFWTHAADVTQMNKICRNQFVALHSEPLLEELSEEFVRLFSVPESLIHGNKTVADTEKRRLNRLLLQIPAKGSLPLKAVKKSIYFFS